MRSAAQGKRIALAADFDLEGAKIGDSIAVNGACLTVVVLQGSRFEADVSPETLQRTAFLRSVIGDRVNLERALRFSDRLDGHLVSGHIDGVGFLRGRQSQGNAVVVTIEAPRPLIRYIIEKGSVAVDGISLTVNRVESDRFQISIIPHTAKLTTIGFKNIGDPVNIETDLIGKYVERFLSIRSDGPSIDRDFLARNGFI
jgi:riboflavin synthase